MIQLEVHSESTAELRRGSQAPARVGTLPAVDKGPPLSKIIIGTDLDMTDLVSSGPGGRGPEANNDFLKRHATAHSVFAFSLYWPPLLLV